MLKKQKMEGQYMTPPKIVCMILDQIGYKGRGILKKTIMEPSFGDGAFLSEIISRIIKEGKKAGLSNRKIAKIIQNNVYGIEKDKELYFQAVDRLNQILVENQIPFIFWFHLYHGDTLFLYETFLGSMDYCVGNPPFVRIHNIIDTYHDVLKKFQFSGGITDLYIIFYEIGLKMLNKNGKLGYISPNSFLRNKSQMDFRQYLLKEKYLSAIFDFKTSSLFENAQTYTCICILEKSKKSSISYREYEMYELKEERTYSNESFVKSYSQREWLFSPKKEEKFLQKNSEFPLTLSSIATVQNGLVTGKDQDYVIEAFSDPMLLTPYLGRHTEEKSIVYFLKKDRVFPIESTILRRYVKLTGFDGTIGNHYIIFPYKAENKMKGKTMECRGFFEEELKKNFPMAYDYFSSIKEELLKRDLRDKTNWFLYSRSQGVASSCFPKIALKNMIPKSSERIVPYFLEEDVVTTNIFLTVNLKNVPVVDEEEYFLFLQKISEIVSSSEFMKYCMLLGRDKANEYIDFNTKIIKEFGIDTKKTPV